MTNHSGRHRDDDAPESGGPASMPPAQTPNGDHSFQPNAAALIGHAVAKALTETLPPLLAEAFSPVTPEYHCATCLIERLDWETAHEADLKASIDQMQIAGQAMQPGDPRLAELSPLMFLPPHLLPSQDPADPHLEAIPVPSVAVVMIGGTTYCAGHVPGVNRAEDAPKRPLLVATTTISPAASGR